MNSLTSLPLAAFGLGGTELIVILLIVLLLFGGTKLPSLARGLGQSVREFKKAASEDEEHKGDKAEAKKSDASKTTGSN